MRGPVVAVPVLLPRNADLRGGAILFCAAASLFLAFVSLFGEWRFAAGDARWTWTMLALAVAFALVGGALARRRSTFAIALSLGGAIAGASWLAFLGRVGGGLFVAFLFFALATAAYRTREVGRRRAR